MSSAGANENETQKLPEIQVPCESRERLLTMGNGQIVVVIEPKTAVAYQTRFRLDGARL